MIFSFWHLDTNSKGEVKAVIATFVDWKEEYSKQCQKFGVGSFVACGVRPALIPLLIINFQDRKIPVNSKGIYSQQMDLNWGGLHGSVLGNLE